MRDREVLHQILHPLCRVGDESQIPCGVVGEPIAEILDQRGFDCALCEDGEAAIEIADPQRHAAVPPASAAPPPWRERSERTRCGASDYR